MDANRDKTRDQKNVSYKMTPKMHRVLRQYALDMDKSLQGVFDGLVERLFFENNLGEFTPAHSPDKQ